MLSRLGYGIFGGYSLWDYIAVLFDNIPKVIYFIYAAVASCLDLLQCVMRKLAGLDTYWVNGQAYTQQDPVLEFIYGMLGIGPNAGAYSALSTVFWSLAIFGVIVLAVSTMIAIIKSHYNEDANKTNPLTHIYTAIKAILTFAIVPVAVILGIYLSQFLLQTLDNITAGKATEDTIRGIYGDNALNNLRAEDGVYTRYDYFGFGGKATSQTFSGMMFRTAAYDANRVRKQNAFYTSDGSYNFFTFGGVLGNTNVSAKPADVSAQDWIAYQIDYAFMNNLQFNHVYNNTQIYEGSNILISIPSVDFFTLTGFCWGFSKYNVGLVWYFYRLWSFNFFVGFASIMLGFGLLTGIIIGLMSRLIRSAALFLIYPATLGLAPLDDWNAFKNWRKEFVSQILMAFGSIIGMNIFFLILPYVNEISWFGGGVFGTLPDLIMNTLIIIVGLLSVKSFIQFMSNMIGAADASATGEGMKKELGSTLVKTGGAVLGAENIGVKAGMFVPRAILKDWHANRAVGKVKEKDSEIASRESRKILDNAGKQANIDTANTAMDSVRSAYMTNAGGIATSDAAYQAELTKFNQRMDANGITDPAERERLRAEMTDEYLTKNNISGYAGQKEIVERGGYLTQADKKHDDDIDREISDIKTERQQLISNNFLTDSGDYDDETAQQIGRQLIRDVTGSVVKGLKEGLGELTGINIGTIGGVFKRFGNTKYDDKGNAVGSYSAGQSNEDYRKDGPASIKQTLSRGLGNIFSASGGPPPAKEDGPEKKMEKSAIKLDKVADALLKATENLKRYKP